MVEHRLTLSDNAHEFIQRQLATGQFGTADEVVSRALEEAEEAAAKQRLAELVREGLDSGTPIPITREYMDRRRAELLSGVSSNQKQ